jgi:RNA polymerase sigma-70 factor (ECF subfamily)
MTEIKNLNQLSDEVLMSLYSKNDNQKAVEVLYRRYSSKVFSFIKKKVFDKQKHEELFQQVFLKLHKSRHLYKEHLPFAPWLFTIIKTVLIDFTRTEKMSHFINLNVNHNEPYNSKDSDVDLENKEDNETENKKELLEWCEKNLNEAELKLLFLRYNDELDFKTIAKTLNLTEVNVRQKISGLIKKIKKGFKS